MGRRTDEPSWCCKFCQATDCQVAKTSLLGDYSREVAIPSFGHRTPLRQMCGSPWTITRPDCPANRPHRFSTGRRGAIAEALANEMVRGWYGVILWRKRFGDE
jgi:hypothetical protein